MKPMDKEILVIGIGNEWRCDDGIGVNVGRRIRDLAIPGVQVVFENRDGISLDEVWRGWEKVIVIDAMCSGAESGAILRINANQTPLKPGAFPQSVHAFGLAEAVELARIMGDIPACLVVYGVEGKRFGHGATLSPEVRDAGERVTERILEEILRLQSNTPEQTSA
jgi:hydrogenase maturation protease